MRKGAGWGRDGERVREPHLSNLPRPLTKGFKHFRIWLRFRQVIQMTEKCRLKISLDCPFLPYNHPGPVYIIYDINNGAHFVGPWGVSSLLKLMLMKGSQTHRLSKCAAFNGAHCTAHIQPCKIISKYDFKNVCIILAQQPG